MISKIKKKIAESFGKGRFSYNSFGLLSFVRQWTNEYDSVRIRFSNQVFVR